MQASRQTTLSVPELAAVTLICFGTAILVSIDAVLRGFPSRPFNDRESIGLIVEELLLAAVALSFLRWRRFDIESLLPVPTFRGALIGVALLLTSYVASALIVAPFSYGHAPEPIQDMVREARMSPWVVVLVAMINGPFEEVFLLGVLSRSLREKGISIALGIPLLVRVLYHLYQGPLGALSILAVGLVFGLYYLRYGILWPPVFAHVLADILPFARAGA